VPVKIAINIYYVTIVYVIKNFIDSSILYTTLIISDMLQN